MVAATHSGSCAFEAESDKYVRFLSSQITEDG